MRIPSNRGRRLGVPAAVSLSAMLVAACAPDAPQDVLQPAGDAARRADDLWNLVFPIAVAIFFIVEGVLIYALIKFRSRPGREPAQFHGNTRLEVLLTAIPAVILAGIAVPTVRTVFDLGREPEGEVLNVTVIGHQFWWEYRYPDLGIVTANELHIPVDTPIRISLQGASSDLVDNTAEVIHSFWIPRLGGKQDVVPGRENRITLHADEPGEYKGQCTEYCGLGHADMRLVAFAHEQTQFEEWVRGMTDPAPEPSGAAAEGARLFQEGQFADGPPCSACHAVDATQDAPNAGPNLAGFANRTTFAGAIFENNDENVAAWLRNPPAAKEGAKMPNLGLTAEQIQALVAYLNSLE